MCGISGIIHFDGKAVSKNILKIMTDAISHRGPDAEGVWINKNVGFGHRRLAIIDPSESGNQPMHSDCLQYSITYNGEIYNYKKIRNDLLKLGYRFQTKTDTEVLLYALVHWRERALEKLNGMFAFAFFDNKEKCLLLARDRYGIKPLYLSVYNNSLYFASEQKAILSVPSFKRVLNKQALFEYFTFQNFLTNQTLINKIEIFPAGNYTFIDLKIESYKMRYVQFWDYNFQEPIGKVNEKDYLNELDFLFQRAVKRQLVSDVELGSYLSGGVDSGSIAAIASKHLPFIKTFTCGFDLSSASGVELGFDERAKAEKLSAKFKTEHYEMVLKAGDMERSLEKLVFHLEEPRVGQSYPNYYSAKLASKFVKVILSGSGGDELFGGYPWRYPRPESDNDLVSYVNHYYNYWQRLIPSENMREIFSPIWEEVKDVDTKSYFMNILVNKNKNQINVKEELIDQSLYFEAKTFLHGLLLVEDKLSMAHGLETRVPFLDNDLVDFALKCPIKFKINSKQQIMNFDENSSRKKETYFEKTGDGKLILRKMMKKYLPKEVIERKKQGFSSPDASWFRGDSINFVKKKIQNKNAKIYDFLDYKSVNNLINDHLKGKENRRLFIWSLINVDEYLDQNF